ncbi:hypothetical protein HPB50_001803 [Hyalomma asiaticum]|uniref:Uncharacterized protein n=1 Tax=Hyalomma asiaticum TaxID=266040 RepID=A0ACB7TFB4_HYAAI|nr:hypothetical protein HPB50_001803 [Hyalomma asiaticum]
MSAHIAVINSIREFYIKEALIPIKVFEVVRRFPAVGYPEEVPGNAALLWLNKCSVKMRHRILYELEPGQQPSVGGPLVVQDLADLNNGCAPATLLSFYCRQHLPWHDLCMSGNNFADWLYNLQPSQRFRDAHFPHDVSFLTALQRKCVEVEPPADHTPLTETVLAKTPPRMSALMAVINGIMELYIKEVIIPMKVIEVVRRFSAVGYPEEVPVDAADAALLWLNKCSVNMRHRMSMSWCRATTCWRPPVLQDLADMNDGCALAALPLLRHAALALARRVPAGRQLGRLALHLAAEPALLRCALAA